MKTYLTYQRLQLKRALRLLPRMLAVTLLLAVLTVLAALLLGGLSDGGSKPEPVRIGLTGDLGDADIARGLELLKSIDSSRFSLSLEPMDEEAAAQALRRGEIAGYAVIPEGFAEALMIGEHRPVTYVSASGGADLGAQLTRELVETISALILETENAVYGAQDLAAELAPGLDPYRIGDRLVLQYAVRILDRSRMFRTETIEAPRTLSLAAGALCGVSLAFLMLWSISCAPLFAGRSPELGRILRAKGLPGALQVLAEYLSYLLLMLCGALAAGVLAGLLLPRLGLTVPELAGTGLRGALSFALAALPTALMIAALQFFLYELADGLVGGVLLQFLSAVVQGYLAGCFYPASFFPEGLRRLGALLPAGAGMAQLQGALGGEGAAGPVWLWLAALLLTTVLLRFRRNRS